MYQVAWPCFAISSPQFVQSLQDPNRFFAAEQQRKRKSEDQRLAKNSRLLKCTKGTWLCLFCSTSMLIYCMLRDFQIDQPTRNGRVTYQPTRIGNATK